MTPWWLAFAVPVFSLLKTTEKSCEMSMEHKMDVILYCWSHTYQLLQLPGFVAMEILHSLSPEDVRGLSAHVTVSIFFWSDRAGSFFSFFLSILTLTLGYFIKQMPPLTICTHVAMVNINKAFGITDWHKLVAGYPAPLDECNWYILLESFWT